ncbi:MAG: YraN family protein [Clostridia bacterium]|nr:YraN family protein [Clostridia bacterium]MDD4048878.1 YraN family protein [Clostridia bacterium]
MDRIALGRIAENFATEYIVERGYRIRERNFRCSFGEIDIIAEENDTLVFVEVRSKQNCNYGLPQETVNWLKQRKLRKLATYYLKRNDCLSEICRFDVIGILFDKQNKIQQIELIKDAF